MPTPPDPAQELLVHDGFVRALARSLLRDGHAAEDVAQETWVAALERGSAAMTWPAWLAGVVRKRAGKHARGQARRTRRERLAARVEELPSEAEILAREAARARVVAAVLALDEPYRGSVLLRFFEGLPPRAIAARQGVPVETVRTRLRRALDVLRARLEREYGDREAWSAALLPWASTGGAAASSLGPAMVVLIALVASGVALALRIARPRSADEPAAASVAQWPVEASGRAPEGTVAARTQARSLETVDEPAAARMVEAGGLRLAVHWSDGTPAPGIQARVESSLVDSPFFRARRGATDGDGALLLRDLPVGPAQVTLDRDWGQRVEIVAGVEAELALTLPRGLDVEGVVVDASGTPVAGAELWLADINAFTGSFVATTGIGGRFALRSCAAGQELGAFAPGHAPSLLVPLRGEKGSRVDIRLVLLGPGGEIAGTVRGPSGEPMADAQVLVGSDRHTFRRAFVSGEGELAGSDAPPRCVRTDQNGRFLACGVPPGSVPVVVRGGGCAPWRSVVELTADEPVELAVALVPEARLVGTVRDASGAPVANAWLRRVNGFGLLDPSCTTGPDGAFRLGGLAPGPNRVSVQESELGSSEETFELAPGEERPWDPVLGLGRVLAGRVLDEGGLPLAGWRVEAHGEPQQVMSYDGAFTAADGRFVLKGLRDLPHRLVVEAPGTSVSVLELGGRRPGTEIELRVPDTRRPSARVRGVVVDASGVRPLDLQLELATESLGMPSEVDAQGRFELGPLVPETYVLRLRARGYPEHVLGPRRLAPQETWDLGTVVLAPAAALVVRAAAPPEAGTLQPWFRLHRASEEGTFDLGPLASAGEGWERPGLAAGRYVLELGGTRVAAARLPLELHPGEERRLEVALRAGFPREIQVQTPPDLGAARVRLEVRAAGGELVVEDTLWPRLPGDYRLFTTLAAGRYTVSAHLPGGPQCTGELRVGGEPAPPLVLELD
ncbi:MAG TPA: sigma-70 family RNA polymerase sigma factor [Planctomycetota bacterium]